VLGRPDPKDICEAKCRQGDNNYTEDSVGKPEEKMHLGNLDVDGWVNFMNIKEREQGRGLDASGLG
jgi:hypothetical protein